ncbi:hypothetical protein GGR57DRAFT_153930 [Xylariaceae sp. FL1272]|nr:hypothetical protein GGR57DRAFT_153930 [Xylariaceae sp. FL1272]
MGPLWDSIIRSLDDDQVPNDVLDGYDRCFPSRAAGEPCSQASDKLETDQQASLQSKQCEKETKQSQAAAAIQGTSSHLSDETPHLKTERDEMVQEIIDRVTPQLQRLAREAAKRELDIMIENALGETREQKFQAVLGRVQDLREEDLEDLFLRRSTMAVVLRRLLERIERLEEENEWEDLGGRILE